MPKFVRAQNVENEPELSATESKTSLVLYGGERTRAAAVVWYLEELGISYQYKSLNIAAGENKQPEYLAINPMGKVPSLVDDDFTIWESGAILWYLAAKYGQMPEDLTTQAKTNQWIIFANSTLGNGLFLEDRRETEMPRLLSPLNKIFQEQAYLISENFTVADVAVGYYLYIARLLFNLDWQEYPDVLNYLNRLAQRQAFEDTIGQR